MPIFARRRLRSMLDDLDQHLDASKRNDLVSRLEHQNTKDALAAEAELAMVWAISQKAHMEIEPELDSSPHRPDAFSENLFASAGAVIEVRALSDDSFSGKEAMDRTANIVVGFADQVCKGAGRHLFFEFMERSYYDNHRFHRERCVDPNFKLTKAMRQYLRQWISGDESPDPERIRLVDGNTDVIISWNPKGWSLPTIPLMRTFCKMPPVAYDLEDNPVYKALKKKSRQIKDADTNTLKCVFLVDVGCGLLRNLKPMSAVHEVGGQDIIWHALRKLSIDIVCVFSPFREHGLSFTPQSRMLWKVTFFDKRENVTSHEYQRLEEVAASLPAPRYEGYQARDRHKQGAFNSQDFHSYLTTTIRTEPRTGKMTIKISSRLVHECLAGRIGADQFKQLAFNSESNFFENQLMRGNTIQSVRMESAGLDEDDDYLIFDLDIDWGAVSLKKKPK